MRKELRGVDGSVIGYSNLDSNGRIESHYDTNGRHMGYTDRHNGTFDAFGRRVSLDGAPGLVYPSIKRC